MLELSVCSSCCWTRQLQPHAAPFYTTLASPQPGENPQPQSRHGSPMPPAHRSPGSPCPSCSPMCGQPWPSCRPASAGHNSKPASQKALLSAAQITARPCLLRENAMHGTGAPCPPPSPRAVVQPRAAHALGAGVEEQAAVVEIDTASGP